MISNLHDIRETENERDETDQENQHFVAFEVFAHPMTVGVFDGGDGHLNAGELAVDSEAEQHGKEYSSPHLSSWHFR